MILNQYYDQKWRNYTFWHCAKILGTIWMAFLMQKCDGKLDLFISRDEMNRTLGTASRVQYISAGTPSHYAIAFPYLVRPNVSYVRFSWRNTAKIGHTMRYWMRVISEDPTAVFASVSVPAAGTVPKQLSQFTLFLQCSGVKLGEFKVRLQLNYTEITLPDASLKSDQPVTAVTLVRRKICAQAENIPPHAGKSENRPTSPDSNVKSEAAISFSDYISDTLHSENVAIPRTGGDKFAMDASHVFYISMGGVSAFVLLVACVIIVYFAKAKKFDENGNECGCPSGGAAIETQVPLCRPTSAVSSNKYASVACANTSIQPTIDSSHQPINIGNQMVNGSYFRLNSSPSARRRDNFNSLKRNCDGSYGENILNVDKHGNLAMPHQMDTSSVYSAVRSSAPFANQLARPSPAPSSSNGTTLYFGAEPRNIDCDQLLSEIPDCQGEMDEKSHWDSWVELQGTFGEMRLCMKRGSNSIFMLKCLKEHASKTHKDNYLREALCFYGIPAHNCVYTLTSLFWAENLPCLVYGKDCSYGNLKHFLQRSSGRPLESQIAHTNTSTSNFSPGNLDACQNDAHNCLDENFHRPLRCVPLPSVATQKLVKIGADLAGGLLHLHRYKVVHGDVAARNAVLSIDFTAKLCDASLSRDLFPNDYDCLGDNENRPLRWMPPEVINQDLREFSSASDVVGFVLQWSLGITLWELATLAAQPYGDLEADEIEPALNDGLRLPHPYNCPDEFYGVMFCCWAARPASRPSAEQLLCALNNFHQHLSLFV